ncbi:MAG: hypothetical protein LBQ40_06625 [Clostridiales bacterium]|jgi:hypothetical protein|nr:hypothetical protein [Clostridiales bacterium]
MVNEHMKNRFSFAASTAFFVVACIILRLLFAPFFFDGVLISEAQDFPILEQADGQSNGENGGAISSGEVRVTPDKVYFLEKTELKFETYEGESLEFLRIEFGDTTIEIYDMEDCYYRTEYRGRESEPAIEISKDENPYYFTVDAYGVDEVKLTAQLEGGSEDKIMSLDCVMYDFKFPRDSENPDEPAEPAELDDSTVFNILPNIDFGEDSELYDDMTKRLTENFKQNADVKIYANSEDITQAVFSDGEILWEITSFYSILSGFFGESFAEYSVFNIKIEYSIYGNTFLSEFSLKNSAANGGGDDENQNGGENPNENGGDDGDDDNNTGGNGNENSGGNGGDDDNTGGDGGNESNGDGNDGGYENDNENGDENDNVDNYGVILILSLGFAALLVAAAVGAFVYKKAIDKKAAAIAARGASVGADKGGSDEQSMPDASKGKIDDGRSMSDAERARTKDNGGDKQEKAAESVYSAETPPSFWTVGKVASNDYLVGASKAGILKDRINGNTPSGNSPVDYSIASDVSDGLTDGSASETDVDGRQSGGGKTEEKLSGGADVDGQSGGKREKNPSAGASGNRGGGVNDGYSRLFEIYDGFKENGEKK